MPISQEAVDYSIAHIHTCKCFGMGFVRLEVPIDHHLFGQAIPCICRRDKDALEKAKRNRRLSLITDSHTFKWKFEDFNVKKVIPVPGMSPADAGKIFTTIIKELRAFAHTPSGWVILTGTYGSGKTHLAYATAIEALGVGHSVYISTVNELLEDLRNAYNFNFDDRLRFLKTVDLLVCDDLGAQRDTDWAIDTFYQIVNYRYANDLPLLVTTNLNLDAPDCGVDKRVLSRLLEGTSAKRGRGRLYQLPASDFRRQKELTS